MNRTFNYSFSPSSEDPAPGPAIDLNVSDIEDAGIREVLQTPGAAYGAWSLMDALLEPTGAGTLFVFKQPLGQAREVKVALSGLFGRFIARAYLERYFGLSIFAHLGNRLLTLDRRLQIEVKRLSKGDLPDWIACKSDLSALTVAEAKGCHDPGGPNRALDRAWTQANRIDVMAAQRKVAIKRIAISTRWGIARPKYSNPYLSVRDPKEEGDPLSLDEQNALFVGLLRLHIAAMIEPLGNTALAQALRDLTDSALNQTHKSRMVRARSALDHASVREVEASDIPPLVGGIVTRAGPITEAVTGVVDQESLARLNFRPAFVGVEEELVRAAIDGETEVIRTRLAEQTAWDNIARPDRAGGWIIPLGRERRII